MTRKEEKKIDLMTKYALDLMGFYDNNRGDLKDIRERVKREIVNIVKNETKIEYES